MRIKFCGAAKLVTGSNYLLETQKTKIVVDCGLVQGGGTARELNSRPLAYDPKKIKAVLITHAHIDHLGRLPVLIKQGFKGKIYSTWPTKDMAKIMLDDSEEINRSNARDRGDEPYYDKTDVEKTIQLFEGIEYGQKIQISPDISFCFRDAGHVLGSAIIEVWAEDKKIVFSGDLGNPPVPLLRPTEFIDQADYVLVESTYGDKLHEDSEHRLNALEDAIEDTVAKGGTLLIPSFALERTQEVLYELNDLVENKRIPQIPVFIDSPLAIKLTNVYKKYPEYFNKEAIYLIKSGDDLFHFPGLKMTQSVQESKEINSVKGPKIILAGSGMSTGGRIIHHEKIYLPKTNTTFLAIAYQVKGTLGRKIIEGQKTVNIYGSRIPVKAHIRQIGGYSAHADQEGLYRWVEKMKDSLKKVFVVHGEEAPANALAQRIRDYLGISALVPDLDQEVEL